MDTTFHLTVTNSSGESIEKNVSIKLEDFSIDEANIEGELCQAGSLLCFYADLAAELDAKAANLKSRLEEVRALQSIEIRKNHTGSRLTENMIDELICSDNKYNIEKRNLIEAQKEAAKANNLFRSMNQKIECLKALAYRMNRQEKHTF